MNTQKLNTLHKIAGISALLVILAFFSSSLYAELSGNYQLIRTVKTIILYSLLLLFVLMPVTVITGRKQAGNTKSPVIDGKLKRMKFIAADAAILIALAVTLYYRAVKDMIDQTFIVIQIAEFTFGLLNVLFLTLMIRDGRILASDTKIKK